MSHERIQVQWPDNLDEALSNMRQGWTELPGIHHDELSLRGLRHELQIVINKLFSDPFTSTPIAEMIQIEILDGEAGFSGTSLFKVTPHVLIGSSQKAAVLKFGPKEEINRESANYDRFVEWFLTVDQTVRKIGYAEANRFAGILYSYPRDVSGGFMSYADYIRTHPLEKCKDILKRMLNVDNQHWWAIDGTTYVDASEANFQDYYVHKVLHAGLYELAEVHFDKLKREVANIERRLNSVVWELGDNTITFPGLNLSIPNPIGFPARADNARYEVRLTIIHGDLHAHNILIDEQDRYFLIDFFYTSIGDIYRDFIELELSIRYDMFCSRTLPEGKRCVSSDSNSINLDGLKKLIRLEKELLKGLVDGSEIKDPLVRDNEDLRKAFELIMSIREFAKENAPDHMHIYWRGFVMSALKAIKYFYPLDVKIYRLILAGLYIQQIDHQPKNRRQR
jgi:hypothetical protein